MTDKEIRDLIEPLVKYSGPGILINSYELQGRIRAAQAFMSTPEAAATLLRLLKARHDPQAGACSQALDSAQAGGRGLAFW